MFLRDGLCFPKLCKLKPLIMAMWYVLTENQLGNSRPGIFTALGVLHWIAGQS